MQVDGVLGSGQAGAIVAAAQQAEAAGYTGVWTTEAGHDPFLPLAIAASSTEHLQLGTAIAVAFARSPLDLAQMANDLQCLSQGRFLLGLGSQIKAHITKRYSMPWSHPAPRMRELILAIRAIWAAWADPAIKLDFRGEFYTHTLMTPFFSPPPHPFGTPPIVLAAVGDRMTEVAGEVGDGLLVHPFTTPRYLAEVSLPALDRGAARAGKSRTDLMVQLAGFVVTGGDDAEMSAAATAVRRQIAFYGSTPAYRPVLERHGWGEVQRELNTLSKRGEWEAMGDCITDEMLEEFAVVAQYEDVPDSIRQRFGTLVDRFSFYTPYAIPPGRMAELVAGLQER